MTVGRLIREALSEKLKSKSYGLGHYLELTRDEQNACRALEQSITIIGNESKHPASSDLCHLG